MRNVYVENNYNELKIFFIDLRLRKGTYVWYKGVCITLEIKMKKIPEVLVTEMRREMDARHLPRPEQVEYFKWLRFYLDFCLKYRQSTRDPETEVLYFYRWIYRLRCRCAGIGWTRRETVRVS